MIALQPNPALSAIPTREVVAPEYPAANYSPQVRGGPVIPGALPLRPIYQIPALVDKSLLYEEILGFGKFFLCDAHSERDVRFIERHKAVTATEAEQHHQPALHCFGHTLNFWIGTELVVETKPRVGGHFLTFGPARAV